MKSGYLWDLLKKVIERVGIRRNGIVVKLPLGKKDKKEKLDINKIDKWYNYK